MRNDSKDLEERLAVIARKVEALEAELMALAADVATRRVWKLMPYTLPAARHLDGARRVIAYGPPTMGSGGDTGTYEPPEEEPGG